MRAASTNSRTAKQASGRRVGAQSPARRRRSKDERRRPTSRDVKPAGGGTLFEVPPLQSQGPDLAGSTRLTQEEEAVSAVARLIETVELTLADDARVIKTIGEPTELFLARALEED